MNANFYQLDEQVKIRCLEGVFGRGKCSFLTGGMCGEIYKFDQGANTFPRYSCIKVPKSIKGVSDEEIARRFIRELERQLTFYYNQFVHCAFDVDVIHNIPVASFRYWGNDLANLIKTNQVSLLTKLSLLVYTCIGLRHCYSKGLVSHQDLKPANIFIHDVKEDFVGLPDLDIYKFAKIADFGLANASIRYSIFDGSRPYMAPEQWNKDELSQATDIFALGVIFYELLTNGYHPVGIKLNDFWPEPQDGKSKKWTREDDWRKWIKHGCKIAPPDGVEIDSNMLIFIEKMLAVKSSDRPNIEDVIEFLYSQISSLSPMSYDNMKLLIERSERKSSLRKDLETDWPYLHAKLQTLITQFE